MVKSGTFAKLSDPLTKALADLFETRTIMVQYIW